MGSAAYSRLALVARHGGKVLEVGLSIISVAYGALLGVFLLGVLTRTSFGARCNGRNDLRIYLDIYLWLCTERPFTWYVVLGSGTTFMVGYCLKLDDASNGSELIELRN